MQKFILSIFTPFLVAVLVRIALFIIGFVIAIIEESTGSSTEVGVHIGFFDTFTWDESYLFWIIVGVLTFFAEMLVWDDDNY
jgi:hypothetical protein